MTLRQSEIDKRQQEAASSGGRARTRRKESVRLASRLAVPVLIVTMAIVAGVLANLGSAPTALAAGGNVTIVAIDRETELTIDAGFRYLIEVDNTHQTSDDPPVSPSITPRNTFAPIVATGCVGASVGSPLECPGGDNDTVFLEHGKYLVTVLAGPFPPTPSDYKMWGAPFTVTGDMEIVVPLVPNPLPTATLRVDVFMDTFSLDGEIQQFREEGLAGVLVVPSAGGQTTADHYGNAICSEYDGNPAGEFPPGDLVPNTGGACYSDAQGKAVIPNLSPGKYEVECIPPDGFGMQQTTSLEGGLAWPVWLIEGDNGFGTEEGFEQAAVWCGFAEPCEFGTTFDDCDTNDFAGDSTVVGRVRAIWERTEILGPPILGVAVEDACIALNNLAGADEQIYLKCGTPDGLFTIEHVPDGQYELVVFDEQHNFIISFYNFSVPGGGPIIAEDGDIQPQTHLPGDLVDLGDIPLPRWFGTQKGFVFHDDGIAQDGTLIPPGDRAGNGVRDCYIDGHVTAFDPYDFHACESGIPGSGVDYRHVDGTVIEEGFADINGYYEFPKVEEKEHFLISEVNFDAPFKHIGACGVETDEFGEPTMNDEDILAPYKCINQDFGAAGLLQATFTIAGSYVWIDWAKEVYNTGGVPIPTIAEDGEDDIQPQTHLFGENGGIAGIVYYGTTRNEFDPRLAGAEGYEPGLPAVINVYEALVDINGEPLVNPDGSLKKGVLRDSVGTDLWDENRPEDCDIQGNFTGAPAHVDPDCIEVPSIGTQIKPGVFNGGYAVEGLDPGKYIVEVVPPDFYRHIREEDQNTDQGDDLVPAVPPPPCAGPLHLVDDERNPAHGQMTPLCFQKLVEVCTGCNAPAEFFLMPENGVPPSSHGRGAVWDDLTVELDPNSPIAGEKRGVPNVPVGVLDFAGNLLMTVYTDENGMFETQVPSTYTALCPTPAGICPGMYQYVANYPGTFPLTAPAPAAAAQTGPDPLFNPNYGTFFIRMDHWAGTWSLIDLAVFPITQFTSRVGEVRFERPPICGENFGRPDVSAISVPYGTDADSFVLTGTNFGIAQGDGEVTLNNVPLAVSSWSDTEIEIAPSALDGKTAGPKQVLVTNDSGMTSTSGITFHLLGTGYDPPLVFVDGNEPPGGDGSLATPFTTIQAGLDDAAPDSLIIVHPGLYFENIIVAKNVKLQGHGQGVTNIDGRFFSLGGLSPEDFDAAIDAIDPDGPSPVPGGSTITVVATDGQFQAGYNPQIDGFAITGGGGARGFGQINRQGGGVYVHAYGSHLQVSNNRIQSNGGQHGGAIILGQPYVEPSDAQNDNVRINNNLILNNGGVSLAGALGIFNGAEDYTIDGNFICGNFSAEYGGAISHFGMSPGGNIRDNDIVFNAAFDEGGGIMVGGELPAAGLSEGSGPVVIERNRIQWNTSNDDGGGVRLLVPVDGPIDILNNMIVNNLATDFGGGIALDDALAVNIINNTIAGNITTSTAEDADRNSCAPAGILASCPHAAGLVSEPHSSTLMAARTPPTDFSDPVLFNNIFWENEAFFLTGMAEPDAVDTVGSFDMEVVFTLAPECFSPLYSIITVAPPGCALDPSNLVGTDPLFVEPIDLDFEIRVYAADPKFVSVIIKSAPGDPPGDYHVVSASPAVDAGLNAGAPSDDFDGEVRPSGTVVDIGADEVAGIVGDADCNGILSMADALAVAQYVVFGEEVACPLLADVSGDGAITMGDGLLIAQVVVGLLEDFGGGR